MKCQDIRPGGPLNPGNEAEARIYLEFKNQAQLRQAVSDQHFQEGSDRSVLAGESTAPFSVSRSRREAHAWFQFGWRGLAVVG